MYGLLIVGGVSMVVPFLVMLSNSFKSKVDGEEFELREMFPRYWTDLRMLELKYLEQQTNYDLDMFKEVARANPAKMQEVCFPYTGQDIARVAKRTVAALDGDYHKDGALDYRRIAVELVGELQHAGIYSDRLTLVVDVKEALAAGGIHDPLTADELARVTGVLVTGTDARKDICRLPRAAAKTEVDDYYAFVETLPFNYTILVNRGSQIAAQPAAFGTHPVLTEYRKTVLARYGSLRKIEKSYNTPLLNIEQLLPPLESWQKREYQPIYTARLTEFLQFKQEQPVAWKAPVPVESVWNRYLRQKQGTKAVDVNAKLGTVYTDVNAAPFPLRKPDGPEAFVNAWADCALHDIPIWFIRIDPSARPLWIGFLRDRYLNDMANYRRAHADYYRTARKTCSFARFEEIPLPEKANLEDGIALAEWNDFITMRAPAEAISIDSTEQRYRDFLQEKYGSLAAVNRSYGTEYRDWPAIYLPTVKVMIAEVESHRGAIRWEFITRNYRTVANFLLLHGRSFFNTAVYILLALFFTLTINPVTAYALSRFKLKATNKVLLFLLATMAFPAEIAMIPNFLILKNLHMLNTYWALVLPGMASGFSIFLLKGMFDGLPQDLYEAAVLDGAGEMTIFRRVTMPLVKPFLAYLALGTFIAAYSAFAFAFLLCPDPKMWTVMVFLQQMSWASQPVKFAAFVLASIPTLIVFVTCQRIIMQGIVLPTEK